MKKCCECECEIEVKEINIDGKNFNLCEECQDIYLLEWCLVCDTYHDVTETEHPCKYLEYNDQLLAFVGAGSCNSVNPCKQGFLFLCDLLGDSFVSELKKAFLSKEYYLRIRDIFFGDDFFLCELMGKDFANRFDRFEIESLYAEVREDLHSFSSEEEKNKFILGIQWLSTLDPENTPEAEATTLTWIEEFQKTKSGNSTAADFLEFAGTWVGEDLQECLQDVCDNRTESNFSEEDT